MTADITARITTTPRAGFGALTSPKVRSILARTDIPRPAFRSRLYLCSHAASIPCFVDASKAAHFEGAPSSASFEGQHAMTPPWSLISLRADSRDLPFQHVMRQRCDQRKGAGIDFCRSPVQCTKTTGPFLRGDHRVTSILACSSTGTLGVPPTRPDPTHGG